MKSRKFQVLLAGHLPLPRMQPCRWVTGNREGEQEWLERPRYSMRPKQKERATP